MSDIADAARKISGVAATEGAIKGVFAAEGRPRAKLASIRDDCR